MKLLITGAAGFIGGNFVRHILSKTDNIEVVALDSLTYAGNLENLAGLDEQYPGRFSFVKADISEALEVEPVFEAGIDAVLNFAAETHVDRSIEDVRPFIRANILGTQVLLDASRRAGVARFVQISTDEVYGSLGPEGKFTEESPICPNNPYSATKAAADFLVRASVKSHKLDAVITRCSNNFGPFQFPEKLIPLMIANALEDKPLPIYGDGLHVRDWIYVEDHCSAVERVFRKGRTGEVYNIGADYDIQNLEVVKKLLALLDKPESLITFIEDRPGHDRRYAMDSARLQADLGWEPKHSFDDALKMTVDWYLDNAEWSEGIRSGNYMAYYERMYADRLENAE